MRRRTSRRAATTAGALLAGLLVGGPVLAADSSVTIADLAFAPGTVTVSEGDSVTWTNQDQVRPHRDGIRLRHRTAGRRRDVDDHLPGRGNVRLRLRDPPDR